MEEIYQTITPAQIINDPDYLGTIRDENAYDQIAHVISISLPKMRKIRKILINLCAETDEEEAFLELLSLCTQLTMCINMATTTPNYVRVQDIVTK